MLAGIDIGGTFTDLVSWEEGRVNIYKLPSTPGRPDTAFFEGLEEGGMSGAERVVHGTTVAINALLERKGARTALVATEGFADTLSIGRQIRPRLYDLMVEKEEPLIPSRLCFGVDERTGPRGEIIRPLREEDAGDLAARLEEMGVEAAAVCLLFSFMNPGHERILGEALRSRGITPHLSSSVLPEYREYERASTVAVNAYVATMVEEYIERLGRGLGRRELDVMHSGGGVMSPREAVLVPARTLMSGPAGGVVAAARTAASAGWPKAIAFDMGGTSTDVSLIDGEVALTAEGSVAGMPLRFPMIDIHSIGAGGGSIARVDTGGALKVGPESAGAYPGPACYGRGSLPTVTDANVVLGRLLEEHFLGGRMRLDPERSERALEGIAGKLGFSPRDTAAGILSVAAAHMAGAVRVITVDRGHDPSDFTMVAFGGAGPMHCCELAEILGVERVIVPQYPGNFSALGLLMAGRVRDRSRTIMLPLEKPSLRTAREVVDEMKRDTLEKWSAKNEEIVFDPSLDLRYSGQSYELMVPIGGMGWDLDSVEEGFHGTHRRRYGYQLSDSGIELVNVRLRSFIASEVDLPGSAGTAHIGKSLGEAKVVFGIISGELKEETCPVYNREGFVPGDEVRGPCLVVEEDATTVVPPRWLGGVDFAGSMILERRRGGRKRRASLRYRGWDPAKLEVFINLLSQVAEEMGAVLCRSSHSPNIKERRDYSCAIFDADGQLVAQAAHIPVHLGALPASVRELIEWLEKRGESLEEGDVVLWNDPFHGGTHLPDITMASAVHVEGRRLGYVVNRAHHADVGGRSPGSMPLGEEVFQEGLIIPMLHYARGGLVSEEIEGFLLANVRTPAERRGDLRDQMGALMIGEKRLKDIAGERGSDQVFSYMANLLDYGEAVAEEALSGIPEGEYTFHDFMDDDGRGELDIEIRARVSFRDARMLVDFEGTSGEVEGPLNCPLPVTMSAVYYVLRCLLPSDAPFNQGCLRRVELKVPRPSLLDASWPRAVAGGNVETSQRVVDVLLGALSRAIPDRIPAASYGTMTNVAVGGKYPLPFAYYETIAGGCGARPGKDGLDATHNHMTNTMNTPVEALEYAYPLRVLRYEIARNTGGRGFYRGGDGIHKSMQFLEDGTITILSDRRRRSPYGLEGGEPGKPGEDWLIRKEGGGERLSSKVELRVDAGDVLEIRTPGGGGYGPPERLS